MTDKHTAIVLFILVFPLYIVIFSGLHFQSGKNLLFQTNGVPDEKIPLLLSGPDKTPGI